MNKTIKELRTAIQEGRQPNCPFCNVPLVVIVPQEEVFRYQWEDGAYWREEGLPCAGVPYCASCLTRSYDFIEGMSEDNAACRQLGLVI
jgi:hypothetical protein